MFLKRLINTVLDKTASVVLRITNTLANGCFTVLEDIQEIETTLTYFKHRFKNGFNIYKNSTCCEKEKENFIHFCDCKNKAALNKEVCMAKKMNAAKKAWVTRKALAEKRSNAAKKAWATRRANDAKAKNSVAAKKAWATRKAGTKKT